MQMRLVLAATTVMAAGAVQPLVHAATPPVVPAQDVSEKFGEAQEQRVDLGARPTYGEAHLRPGFEPNPYRVSLTSGGMVDASTIDSRCQGMIGRAPDFRLVYAGGSLPLKFDVEGDTDTTLVINGPDGQWSCDDDSGSNTQPQITYQRPGSGRYDVWVGASRGSSGSAQLRLAEFGRQPPGGGR